MPQTFDISSPQPSSQGGPTSSSGSPNRGTGTAIDDFARWIFYLAAVCFVPMLGYLLWGIFGGSWSDPNFTHVFAQTAGHNIVNPQDLNQAGQQQLANIAFMGNGLLISAIIGIIGLIICSFRDEGLGYVFGIAAAIVYFGLPYLTTWIYGIQNVNRSYASEQALQVIQATWWVFAAPGVIFVIVDMIRRLQAASEAAAVQRANMKYGSGVAKQRATAQQQQKFLGRCWELPYCREHVRTKCPIYNRRRGPCWWYKEGCMCEERIVLQAVIANDWKQQAATAEQKMHLTAAAPKALMSQGDKRERCRKCVIYNEHQRQKYKLFVGITLVVVPALLYLNSTWLATIVSGLLGVVATATARFSFDPNSNDAAKLAANSTLQDIMIVCVGLVLVAQALKLVEYLCFKLKI